jgi:hypothetical protein
MIITRVPFIRILDMVSFDGTFYLNQARVLFSGSTPPGAFPIGYPLLVACLLPVLHDTVRAAQVVSFLSGFGSVIIIYILAKEYMKREMAFFCAASLAITPLFIRLSLTTFSESLYIFWVLLGLLLFSRRSYVASGIAFGVAAITRPEVLAIVGLLALLRFRQHGAFLKLVVAFAFVYSLNVTAFYAWTGKVELLPKKDFLGSSSEGSWQAREKQLEEPWQAEFRDLIGAGRTPQAVAKNYLLRLPKETLLLGRHIVPLTCLLAILGMIMKPEYLLVSFVPFLFYPLFTVRGDPRYILPYIPIAILYAFIAAVSLRNRTLGKLALIMLILSPVLGAVVNRAQVLTPVDEGYFELKDAGLKLRDKIEKGTRIADRKPYVAFYAEGQYVEIPNGPYEDIMTFLREESVEYLSLHAWVVKKMRPSLWPLITDRQAIRGETRFRQYYLNGKGERRGVWIYRRDPNPESLSWRRLTYPLNGFDSSPSWSPDGRTIAFSSSRGGNLDIYTVPADGGQPRIVVDWPSKESFPVWSPDGTRIAFNSTLNGSPDIYVIELATGHATRVTSYGGIDMGPSWSGDGQVLVFCSDRSGTFDIWSKHITSGSITRISEEGRNVYPTVSPRGDRIAWIKDAKYVAVYTMETGALERHEVPIDVNYPPAWSPDQGYLAVTSKNWGSIDVYLSKSNGAEALLLTKQNGFEGFPRWSPAGNRLAIVSDREDDVRSIWILDNLEPFIERFTTKLLLGTLTEMPSE